ncbi:MAG TPA: methyltransferase domain-containing protein [Rhizomicrobium sp.]|jgi:SAM-dependent methyltransferase|nr:methyltransferase domain-containing protein [Rhizomicrobium sp.]
MQAGSKDPLSFYEEPIGQVTRRTIYRRIRLAWPDVRGQRVLGYGFPLPYLRPFDGEAERVAALVPAQLEPGATDLRFVAQGEEEAWPFVDSLFDRILVVHGLECAEAVRPLLRQIWRVLAPEGRVILVVPNRASLWAQIERSPFAHGRPFSRAQIDKLMRDSMFVPERWDSALYFPPVPSRRLVRSGVAWERVGRAVWPRLAGVHIVEVTKSLYALAAPEKARARKRRLLAVAR